MRRLVRSTAILGLGSAATVVATILRAKVLAALLGPQGTGVIAQLSSLTGVLVPIATLGMGNGVIAMIAAARSRGDAPLVRRIQTTVLTLALLVSVALMLLAALASPWLTFAIYHDRAWVWVVLVGAATVPLSAVASLRTTMLQGHEAISSLAALNAVVAGVGIVAIVPMAWFFGLPGAVAQLLVVGVANALVSGRLLRTHAMRALDGPAGADGRSPACVAGPGRGPLIDRSLLRPLMRYGSSALLVGLSSTLTLLVIRSALVSKLGLEQNGIYQVCVGVSGLYVPIILNSITSVVWPQIAGQRSDEETGATIRQAMRLAFLLLTAASGAMLAGAPLWVPLFYSQKFLPALELLPIQFLGDFFRTAAWMFGIWLVPKNWLRPWVLFDVVYGIAMVLGFWLLVDRFGIRSVVYAYVAAHVTHAVLHYLWARRSLGFRIGADNRRLLLASFALLLGLARWTPRDLPGVALGLAAIAAWALLVVRRQEWIAAFQKARGLLSVTGRRA